MIPRKLHHIWVGPKPVPTEWAHAWESMHPGWECRIWREADLAAIPMPNRAAYEDFLARKVWHGAADIARVAILLTEGGVYVDIDSRPLRSLDGAPFMAESFFAAYEPVASLPGRLANGTIGSEAGHPILRTYAELVGKMEDLSEPWDTCGGTALTAAVLVHRQCCKPAVLPSETFYPRDHGGRAVGHAVAPYSEHFWATTNSAYPGRYVILVPRRSDGGRRDQVWAWVRAWWERLGWPIYEGHHDGPGRFNASAARNEAARLAGDWEAALFVDADTITFDLQAIPRAVQAAMRTGKFIRPSNRYILCDEAATRALMETGKPPRTGVRPLRPEIVHGGVHVVPRPLWDAVGGYDERFVGWGSEDTAFELACTVLGGYQQLPGEVYHLWHPIGADRNTSDPGFIANVALRRRYEAARRPSMMRGLLAERDGCEPAVPLVGAVITTNGRREQIARTIATLDENVRPVADRIICDDSGDDAYVRWLMDTFPGWRVLAHPHQGHGEAIRYALAAAGKLDVDWIWWSEDDYSYERPVDLTKLAATMEQAGDDLKQLSLKRQAWFPAEREVGPTVIDRFDPGLFTPRSGPSGDWLEHRLFYTLNPHLARRDFIRTIAGKWPPTGNNEHLFSVRLFRDPRVRCGIWGARSDPPWVIHDGERTGSGY